MTKIITITLAATYFLLVLPSRAEAYFDPGTGSLVLQVLAAFLVGLGVFWTKIKTWVSSLFNRKKNEDPKQ